MQLPPELDFLLPLFDDPTLRLTRADWLLSDFNENFWKYSFGFKEPKTIDWNVKIDDGTLLTAPKNHALLAGLKYFLVGSTGQPESSSENSKSTRQIDLNRAIHIVDFLLLNAKRFNLARLGLEGLGRDDLMLILSEISSNKDTAESIYGWSKRVTLFCLNLALETSSGIIATTLQSCPELTQITPEQIDNNMLDIPIEIIPQVRAALYLNGFYRHSTTGKSPNSALISQEIYSNTIKGKLEAKPTPVALKISNDSFDREYNPISVTTGRREQMGVSGFREYRRILYSLGSLHELGLPAPQLNDLAAIEGFNLELTTTGRFRSLPSPVVFGAVRNAIEFHLSHGKKIIDGWCRVVLHCRRNSISYTDLTDKQLPHIIGKDLVDLGVRHLGLSRRNSNTSHGSKIKGSKKTYFNKLRANHGLVELVKVYVGCVQVVVGALTGRRVGELLDLETASCLDASGQWILFLNRKSTYRLFGTRQSEARPVEPIAAQMIKSLIRLQKIILKAGEIRELKRLFSSPLIRNDMVFTNATLTTFNQNLDFFCDYFETQVNEEGKRFYIRQHQLRRFFAMLFFYSSSFGGIETLQWMLGHTDMNHLWNYITESMDGATLNNAKAQFVAECLSNDESNRYGDLTELIKSKYGIAEFSIQDTEELEEYLLDLLDEGSIDITPDFFEDNDGTKFKIVVKLINK